VKVAGHGDPLRDEDALEDHADAAEQEALHGGVDRAEHHRPRGVAAKGEEDDEGHHQRGDRGDPQGGRERRDHRPSSAAGGSGDQRQQGGLVDDPLHRGGGPLGAVHRTGSEDVAEVVGGEDGVARLEVHRRGSLGGRGTRWSPGEGVGAVPWAAEQPPLRVPGGRRHRRRSFLHRATRPRRLGIGAELPSGGGRWYAAARPRQAVAGRSRPRLDASARHDAAAITLP
jgi:hypothetical protein